MNGHGLHANKCVMETSPHPMLNHPTRIEPNSPQPNDMPIRELVAPAVGRGYPILAYGHSYSRTIGISFTVKRAVALEHKKLAMRGKFRGQGC
jgi:hypothetical protein